MEYVQCFIQGLQGGVPPPQIPSSGYEYVVLLARGAELEFFARGAMKMQ